MEQQRHRYVHFTAKYSLSTSCKACEARAIALASSRLASSVTKLSTISLLDCSPSVPPTSLAAAASSSGP